MSITDIDGIRAMGLQIADVTHLLGRAFNAQIFDGGFVHCDPHPGNVLVRARPERPSQPQLVLLDHGLYRELPSAFVQLYAQLWLAVLTADADGIRRVSHALGVGDYYPLFAAMLTGKPWADILNAEGGAGRLAEKGTVEDKAAIRGYAQQYAKGIAVVLERVPAPMLLLFKTNDCLRHAERKLLGAAAGVDSMLVTMRYCLQALLRLERSDERPGERMAYETADGAGKHAADSAMPLAVALPSRRTGWARRRLHRLQLAVAVWLLRSFARSSGALLEPLLHVLSARLRASSASTA